MVSVLFMCLWSKVTFPDVDNFPFQFMDGTWDGPARYSIITYFRSI